MKYREYIVRYYASHDDIPAGHQDGEIVAELVRCKDCASWRQMSETYGECYDGLGDGKLMREDDFCSCGERRDE